ncbi:MAG: transposase [Oscillospiraceae bacterium]|nr:transposase [Oscillospiraceae bacterium]
MPESLRKYFKRSKSLLSKSMDHLTPGEMNRLSLMFEISPRLARAYYLKNKFLSVMHSSNSAEGRKNLSDWLFLAEFEKIPEFSPCITAYRNWFQEILNSFDVPYSNGYTEGCNNKT